MNTNKLMLAALLACTLGAAAAAENGPQQQRDAVVVGPMNMQAGNLNVLVTAGVMRMHGKPIKGAPYIAQELIERQQTLSDGNQIVNTSTTMSYRDSEGRTRSEQRGAKGELSITINDPVAGVSTMLRPQDKTAMRFSFSNQQATAEAGRAAAEASRAAAQAGRAAAEAARARVAQLRKEGKLADGDVVRVNADEIIVKQVQRDNADTVRQAHDSVRIATRELTAPRMRELSELGPILASASSDFKWAKNSSTKNLGTRDFAGVKAQGKLRSYEIPAGEIGNRNPIVVSDESWWSPELQITVYSKHSDPRTGDNIYRLENLKREEPAAALFTVPSDYTVKDRSTPRVATNPSAPKAN